MAAAGKSKVCGDPSIGRFADDHDSAPDKSFVAQKAGDVSAVIPEILICLFKYILSFFPLYGSENRKVFMRVFQDRADCICHKNSPYECGSFSMD